MANQARRGVRWMIPIWYVVVIVATTVVLVARSPDPDSALIFDELEFAPLENPASELGERRDWRAVSLPDNWRDFPGRQRRAGAYRGRFTLTDQPLAPWAIQVPTFSSELSVRVNGRVIDESLPYGAVPPLDHSLPFLARIPAHLLHAGENQFEIRLDAGGISYGFLDRLFVGPDTALRPNYRMRWFLAVTVPQWVLAWEMILAVAMLILWLARPSEQAAVLFCAILAWAVVSGLPLVFYDQPLSQIFWSRLSYLADIWQASLAVPFAYHFVGRRPPRGLFWIFVLPLVATALGCVLPQSGFELVVYTIVLPFGLSFLCWCWWVLAASATRSGHVGAHCVTASLICVVAFTLHDVLIIYNIIGSGPFYLLRYSFLLVLTVISGALIGRFIHSLGEVEHLLGSWQARICEKENELALRFAQQRSIERRKDLNEERARLMRDMHDGLGGQLVSVVALAEQDEVGREIADIARRALDDLRLVIASLDVDEEDLPALLGTFRERLERQLATHGLELEWQMGDFPGTVGLGPSTALQILRILQEAVTNIVKHAQATTVHIAVTEGAWGVDRVVEITVEDDGRGGIEERSAGNGLANMRARATSIGARLDVESSRLGSSVRLFLPQPLSRPAA